MLKRSVSEKSNTFKWARITQLGTLFKKINNNLMTIIGIEQLNTVRISSKNSIRGQQKFFILAKIFFGFILFAVFVLNQFARTILIVVKENFVFFREVAKLSANTLCPQKRFRNRQTRIVFYKFKS